MAEFQQRLKSLFSSDERGSEIVELLEKRLRLNVLVKNAETTKKQTENMDRAIQNVCTDMENRMQKFEKSQYLIKQEMDLTVN